MDRNGNKGENQNRLFGENDVNNNNPSFNSYETFRQRAYNAYLKFYNADLATNDAIEQNMHDTEDAIFDAFGEEEGMKLLTPEIDFMEGLYSPWSVVPAILTTATSMLMFRKGPAVFRNMTRYRSSSSSSVNSTNGSNFGQTSSGTSGYQLSQPMAKPRSRVVSTLRFVAEFAASSLLGLAVFDYTIGPVEENEEATKIPLVEGISITSMYKCPAYISIYGSESQEGFWNRYKGALSDSDEDKDLRTSLEYYESWAVNCARRDMVARATKMQIEMKRGNQLAPTANIQSAKDRYAAIAIPTPGVPEDLPVDKESIGKRAGTGGIEEKSESNYPDHS